LWQMRLIPNEEISGLVSAGAAGTGKDSWGYATHGEEADFGGFLGGAAAAVLNVWKSLVTLQ